ncbi:MAG: epoxyqueuosine reductase QueH [Candidatus Aureabacteria bacterium]|nr:epoxyqueuosine reductase QueH [Candidatus Auribacterota bacterium]
MRILLHVCCGPCATHPFLALKAAGHAVEGYFYNPNIHPFQEWKRRREALEKFSSEAKFPVRYPERYNPEEYFRAVSFHEDERCPRCYRLRLVAAAREAKAHGFDAFTSTLLISVKQKHDLIRRIGEETASAAGIAFFYQDFRTGWNEHWKITEQHGLYKQQYCGCLFSERERYGNGI